jgi:hypothetical protein
MLKSDTHKTLAKGRTTKGDCCTDLECEAGLKNNYFEGKRLTPDSFRVEQRYLVERRRLLNRSIHGWGVVYGYGLEVHASKDGGQGGTKRQLTIQPGLALDSCGRELLQVGRQLVDLERIVVLDAKGTPIKREDRQAAFSASKECWLLRVHYAEQDTDSMRVTDACRCERDEWDHACETVRYSLQTRSWKECCKEPECGLTCKCRGGRCCGQDKTTDSPHPRGGCRCLCEHLTELNPGDACVGHLCQVDEFCGGARVDLKHGVDLACVEVVDDGCEGWTFGAEVEACGPRRLVKRNDLLFDLIRGCDLTRISAIGWKEWHRRKDDQPMPFADFARAIGAKDRDKPEYAYVADLFSVRFSRPVRKDTLRTDCFAMTVIGAESEGGWWQTLRVPIVDLDYIPADDGDPSHVQGASMMVYGPWCDDAVGGSMKLFQVGETRIEIEIRGDFIVDCNGQTVDANAVGLSAAPTGNGAPGGTFVSTFRVEAAPPPLRRPPAPTSSDRKGV